MSKSNSEDPFIITKNKDELRLNTWLLPLLILIFLALYLLTGFRGWLIFLLGTAGVWLLALVWVVSLRRNLRVERNLHLAWATVGDSVQEELKLINTSRLPAIWVEILDTSRELSRPIQMVSDVGARSTRTRFLSHQCRQRGLYILGPTRLRTSDPFGIFELTMYDYHSDTILITPPLLRNLQLRVAPAGWAGDQRMRQGALQREISDTGLRSYLPGDSLKQIHWRATARLDQLTVRLRQASAPDDWWIFVDLDQSVQSGKDPDSTSELGIILAATLAMRGLAERRRVGLALAGPDLVWLEPRSDPVHRWRILRALAVARVGEHSFTELFKLRHPGQPCTIIAITPSPDPGWIMASERGNAGGKFALLINAGEFGDPVDRSGLSAALAQRGIPFQHIVRSLLKEAYPAFSEESHRHGSDSKALKRFLKQGRTAWQLLD
jgi:uncharacterized protein (DUF58 family)